MEVKKIVLFERLKISYFIQLNCNSIMGNYLKPYKEEKKKKLFRLNVSILLSVC